MRYLIHPERLITKAVGILSFKEMITEANVQFSEMVDMAVEVATEWTEDWDEEDGFGSSDGTYMLKDFIDRIIASFANGYKATFNPYLTIEKI